MADYVHRQLYSRKIGAPVHELTKFDDTSAPTESYDVWRDKKGNWKCTCPATYRGLACKHPAIVQLFTHLKMVGYLFDADTGKFHDLFPLPQGANGLLVDVRGEQLDE